jgi:hypothetical protein
MGHLVAYVAAQDTMEIREGTVDRVAMHSSLPFLSCFHFHPRFYRCKARIINSARTEYGISCVYYHCRLVEPMLVSGAVRRSSCTLLYSRWPYIYIDRPLRSFVLPGAMLIHLRRLSLLPTGLKYPDGNTIHGHLWPSSRSPSIYISPGSRTDILVFIYCVE